MRSSIFHSRVRRQTSADKYSQDNSEKKKHFIKSKLEKKLCSYLGYMLQSPKQGNPQYSTLNEYLTDTLEFYAQWQFFPVKVQRTSGQAMVCGWVVCRS